MGCKQASKQGRMDGWMDGWMDGCMYVCWYACMSVCRLVGMSRVLIEMATTMRNVSVVFSLPMVLYTDVDISIGRYVERWLQMWKTPESLHSGLCVN